MLESVLAGYNCTMFAYGQTGAGKSYSFVGYGANKGILPLVSNQIFEKVRAGQSERHVFQIGCSYMEVRRDIGEIYPNPSPSPNPNPNPHPTLTLILPYMLVHADLRPRAARPARL